MTRPLVIYHGNCADGYTAAWVAWRHFKENADLFPGVYNDSPPDCVGRDVYILDFSYSVPVMEKIMEECASLTVLDHHESAMKAMMGWLPNDDPAEIRVMLDGKYWSYRSARSNGGNGIRMIFDMTRSGSLIARQWFFPHPEATVPKLVQYVSDRDLWEFKLPNSREIAAWYFSHPYTMRGWDTLASQLEDPATFDMAVIAGRAIERKHFKDIKEFIEVGKRRMTIAGHTVWVLNCPYQWSSDACHIMAEGEPFAASYFDKEGFRVFSLRSSETGLNVSEIAKNFGGGGHEHSSGFSVPIEQLKDLSKPSPIKGKFKGLWEGLLVESKT